MRFVLTILNEINQQNASVIKLLMKVNFIKMRVLLGESPLDQFPGLCVEADTVSKRSDALVRTIV